MKTFKYLLLIILMLTGCVVQFVPEAGDYKDYIVVDALITDQNNTYKIEISKTAPLGETFSRLPVTGGQVTITDDLGNNFQFTEALSGQYISDSLAFRGQVGRSYTLHIKADGHQYESMPVEMKPVPPIDSLYAEIIDNNTYEFGKIVQGYQVYLDTHDPTNECKFFRWDFAETWEFHIPYFFETIVNTTCWKSAPSKEIYIENTSSLIEDRVSGFPLNFITTETDRLTRKYSILLRQYSLNEDEFNYWDKLKRITEEVGGLYDVVPVSIESNIFCTDSPEEKVLGYFSVSSVSTKRLFIKSALRGFPDFYKSCPFDTVSVRESIPFLNITVFILQYYDPMQSQYILTLDKRCVDCTQSGTNKMPDYWNPEKNDIVIENALR